MARPDFTPGVEIGPWTLRRHLGTGGNAEVWEARRHGDAESVALKILKARVGSERYGRFRTEIAALSELGASPGILPMVDFALPGRPRRGEHAWIAMPVAAPIDRALAGEPVPTVVAAVASIAETLAGLAGNGVYHRDIKPANLYFHDDRFVVGDFGLVALPDLSGLTAAGRALGPRYFMAPELLVHGAGAVDWERCDVFSLGKTLWSLAAEAPTPPPGPHEPSEQYALVRMRPHAEIAELDALLAKATGTRPEFRPSMADLAVELRAWLQVLEQGGGSLRDATTFIDAIRAQLQPVHDERDRKTYLGAGLERAKGYVQERLEPIRRTLRGAFGYDFFESLNDIEVSDWLGTPRAFGVPECWGIYPMSLQGLVEHHNGLAIYVRVAVVVELLEPGNIRLSGMVDHGIRDTFSGDRPHVAEVRIAPSQSARVRVAVNELVSELELALPGALSAFQRLLEGP